MELLLSIKKFCAEIGQNRLLVQGGGGNISFKKDDILWIKASGAWIGEAQKKEIFTPVDLRQLQAALQIRDYNVKPVTLGAGALKPSIETLLHALMPHKIVLHLHAIEALAYLVQKNAYEQLSGLIGDTFSWKFIHYHKPGAELARAVHEAISQTQNTNLLFLESHGVVIGSGSLKELRSALSLMSSLLQKGSVITGANSIKSEAVLFGSDISLGGYTFCDDEELNKLATDPMLFDMVKTSWALYPDHVVFLGPEPVWFGAKDINEISETRVQGYPYIFIEGIGVLEKNSANGGQRAQLRCYYDTLIRQPNAKNLSTLSMKQIHELLSWDDEKFRQANGNFGQ